MHIFGLPIANHTREEILSFVREILAQSTYRRVVTLNPEFLLLAEKEQQFRECLGRADYQVIDGVGLGLAFALSGGFLRGRFPGVDLLEFILEYAQQQNLKVFFAVRSDGLSHADEVLSAVRHRYPTLQTEARDLHPDGFFLPSKAQSADIIVSNFGAPFQEYFLEGVRRLPGSLKLGIGVGGSFDYLTNKLRRAPVWMRMVGGEWIYRLWQQPWRLPRILRATVLFPIRLFFARI